MSAESCSRLPARTSTERQWPSCASFGLDEYFLYPQINWNSKASSVEEIRRSLNTGIDAVAFVDDQPFEREEVAHSHPQVLCIDSAALDRLLGMPELSPEFITQDTRARRRMYMADIARNQAEAEFVGPSEEFQTTLGMRFGSPPLRERGLRNRGSPPREDFPGSEPPRGRSL